MTNPEDSINPIILRKTGDGCLDYRIASIKDQREGIFLFSSYGLTKREYFAAMAMQGMLANSRDYGDKSYEDMAKSSVYVADSLINELNKQ
jgi:hypothetical protein